MRPTLFAFLFLSLLLIGAIALIAYGNTRPRVQTFHGKLAELLPEAPQGWTRTIRPVADTPEMQKRTAELLNFDDGVFADYTNGTERLSVYVAYWTPGRMSHRLVATHTPDVCWVNVGWKCVKRGTTRMELAAGSSNSGKLAPTHLSAGHLSQLSDTRHQFFPAESRTFTAHGTTEYVWFWHIVGGRPKSYGTGAEPPWHASLVDLFTKGLNQRDEQFFIRLSTPQDFTNPGLAPVLEPLLQSLPLRQLD